MNEETQAVWEAIAVYAPEVPEAERVPPGYRQTEGGAVPENWEVVSLSDLVTSGPRNGYSGRSEKNAEGTPTLSLAATSSGHLILNEETVKHLYETISPRSDLFLESGDVLVQRSNTLDLVGTTVVFDGPSEVYVYPDLMMRMRFKDDATAHWFWRYANSTDGRRYFVSIAAGSTGSMPKISGEKLRKMPLPVPPLPEQHAIATALSDVDALISSLDRLISKKRAVMTAAMQQLLTGKQRLPGFSGEWGVKSLEEVADVDSDNLTADTDPDYQFKYISLDDVDEGVLRGFSYQRFSSAPSRARRRVRFGDVLVSTVRPNLRSHLLFSSSGGDWVCSTGFSLVRCRKHLASPGFVYQHLFHGAVPKQIEALIAGSSYPAISAKDVRAFQIPIPSLEEQTAIATVLSDMDAAISALESRREKTRQVKQGMMQELLTGRTRLV